MSTYVLETGIDHADRVLAVLVGVTHRNTLSKYVPWIVGNVEADFLYRYMSTHAALTVDEVRDALDALAAAEYIYVRHKRMGHCARIRLRLSNDDISALGVDV